MRGLEPNGIFTTVRVQFSRCFYLDAHLRRLEAHCLALGTQYVGDEAILQKISETGLPAEPHLLRIQITPLTLKLDLRKVEAVPSSIYQEGVRLHVSRWQVHPQLCTIKCGAYLPYLLAKQEALRHNCFEALLLNHEGYVVDGSRSAIVLFKENTCIAAAGGIDSITRRHFLDAARRLGMACRTEFLRPEDINLGFVLIMGTGIGLLANRNTCDLPHTLQPLIGASFL